MKISIKLLLSALFIMVMQLACFSNSTRAKFHSEVKLDPGRVPWLQLTYGVKNFSVEVNVQVRLDSLPTAEVEAALIKSPQGNSFRASVPKAYRISLQNVVEAITKSPVKTTNHVWFNPQDATALGRVRLRRGNDDFKKVYRFTEQGVFRHRREPKNQEETFKQPEKWTDVKDTFYTYDLDELGCPNITERLVLIYIASASEISKIKQPLSYCVFGRRQLFRVGLKPDGFHSLKVDYLEKKQQGEIRRRGTVKALKLALETQPLASDPDDDEDFSLLGFEKDIAIFIDPVSGLPVQLNGNIPKIGQLIVKLREVRLK